MCFDRMEFTRILRLHGLRPKNERRISMKKHPLLRTALLVMTAAALLCVSALAVEDGASTNSMYGTFWALVPPVIAITLALITKEAYSSLFIGVTVGALFSQGFSPIGALNMIVNDGLVAAIKDNAGIFLFLVLLGIIVALVNAAGGNLPYKPVELIRYDNIGGGDACTGFGKAPHRIAPDQSARPRNQCYFSMQLFFHHDSPCSKDFR